MKYLVWFFSALLVLKVIWNAMIPWDIAWRTRQGTLKPGQGVSLMPYLEVFLYLVVLYFNWIGKFPYSGKVLALWGGLAILGSYLLIILGGSLANFLLLRGRDRSQ